MLKKLISLMIVVCMLPCFAACGTNRGNGGDDTKEEKSPGAGSYEEAVKMYFDAVFDPTFDSDNIRYLAPGDFWADNLGGTSLNGVIKAHREKRTLYLEKKYGNDNISCIYTLDIPNPEYPDAEINILTPNSASEGDLDYADNVEWIQEEFGVKIDSGSTLYWLDNIPVPLYNGEELFDVKEFDIIVFQVDGVWYTANGLEYLKERIIEYARYYDYG